MVFLCVPRVLMMLVAGPEEAKNLAGRGVLRLIQIRLAKPSLRKPEVCVKVETVESVALEAAAREDIPMIPAFASACSGFPE